MLPVQYMWFQDEHEKKKKLKIPNQNNPPWKLYHPRGKSVVGGMSYAVFQHRYLLQSWSRQKQKLRVLVRAVREKWCAVHGFFCSFVPTGFVLICSCSLLISFACIVQQEGIIWDRNLRGRNWDKNSWEKTAGGWRREVKMNEGGKQTSTFKMLKFELYG